MKKSLFFHLLATCLLFLMPIYALADEQIIVRAKIADEPPINHPKIDPEGDRAPARPIFISISAEYGVSIPAVDKDDVLSYSIYDEDGMMLASFTDDIEFASTLLSSNGTLEIRIHLDDYTLCGWLEL